MEQLRDAPQLARESKRRLFSELAKDTAQQNLNSPEHAWSRLTGITLDTAEIGRHGLVTSSEHRAALWFDQIRARVLFQMRSCQFKRLAIASPMPQCGTTTVAANLALSMARQSDLKVMLFDFHLRQPDMISKFGLQDIGPRHAPLSGGRRTFDSSTLRVGPNLALSLSAMATPAPAELLASNNTKHLIDRIETDFEPDVMIFDLPPLLPFDDALMAMSMMDCALLVAGADRSKIEEVDEAERLVSERTQSLGVILNRCRFIDQTAARHDKHS